MSTVDFWQLLPSAQRADDAARGYPLRALLDILSEQANLVRGNIAGLWDDYFIETCAEWAIPYLGELVGNVPLEPVPPGPRADVASTIHFRRRKGTLPMLEELAGSTTGWPAHVVAFFEQLGWTQHTNHLRPGAASVDLRDATALARLGTAFNTASHTVDIRPADGHARPGITGIGFFLWRLGAYQLRGATPRPAPGHPHGYHFSPLGHPAPLFNAVPAPVPAAGTGHRPPPHTAPAKSSLAQLPGPIRHADFHLHPTDHYRDPGPGSPVGLSIVVDGERIPASAVRCQDLRNWAVPAGDGIRVGIDVVRGRFAFAAGAEPADAARLRVDFGYGFGSDTGGGPYLRAHLLERADPAVPPPTVLALDPGGIGATLAGRAAAAGETALLELPDSRSFEEAAGIGVVGGGLRLVLRAANGQRPHLRGVLTAGADAPEHLVLDGLLIEGHLEVAPGSRLRSLTLLHCTLVPGRALDADGTPAAPDAAALLVGDGNGSLRIELDHCITGPLRIPAGIAALAVRDSILDHPGDGFVLAGSDDGIEPGPASGLERSTVLGRVHVAELELASESLFGAPVTSRRRQHGCVRFSYVPEGSLVPGQYRCQPATALEQLPAGADRGREQARLLPTFTSRRYGQPGYAQLAEGTAAELRTGAANGAEMGVFNELLQPQREANLRTRIQEYLPFGLEPNIIHVT